MSAWPKLGDRVAIADVPGIPRAYVDRLGTVTAWGNGLATVRLDAIEWPDVPGGLIATDDNRTTHYLPLGCPVETVRLVPAALHFVPPRVLAELDRICRGPAAAND